ncbi:MAG: hypothetical protein KF756_02250 [Acidobacteria bacterium]|nr:hypothetical protein [Acidobacteriota bacterium]
MDKLKLEERVENAITAFFQDGFDLDLHETQYSGRQLTRTDDETFVQKVERSSEVLRAVFLFGPGAISLFLATLSLMLFYPTLGATSLGIFMTAGAAFFTLAGSGNIKDLQNLAIPASIMVLALIYFGIAKFVAGVGDSDLLVFAFYLLPVVFITGKGAQNWVNSRIDDNPANYLTPNAKIPNL